MRITIALFILASFTAYSQSYIYLNEAGAEVKTKDESYLYRHVAERGNKHVLLEFYSADDSKKLEAEGILAKEEFVFDGTLNSYEPGGKPSFMQVCTNGACKFGQYWMGSQPMLTNGSGVIDVLHQDGSRTIYDFRDSLAYSRCTVDKDTRDSLYTMVEVKPSYPGGEMKFVRDVYDAFKYSKRGGERGKCFTEFWIDKTGTIIKIKVISSIGPRTTELINKKLASVGKWNPALVDGRPVNSNTAFVIPMSF